MQFSSFLKSKHQIKNQFVQNSYSLQRYFFFGLIHHIISVGFWISDSLTVLLLGTGNQMVYLILSVTETRWGEEKKPVLRPCCRRMDSQKAQVDPFPFVPLSEYIAIKLENKSRIAQGFFNFWKGHTFEEGSYFKFELLVS